MLVFKYSKLGGAEFISHLDMLRHIQKILIRAKIDVAYSKGFNPHIEIFLSPPVFVGLKTTSEYCLVETNEAAESFKEKFNTYSQKGIKCLSAFNVSKRHKIASLIDSAGYIFEGNKTFSVDELLAMKEIFITAKDGSLKNVREKIFEVKFIEDGKLYARLAFGNDVLRADYFAQILFEKFGYKSIITKIEAFSQGRDIEEILN